jgi:Tfp pilus assembly protein PilN
MSVAINLLPDIRQTKLQDQSRRRLITVVAVSIWAVSAAVVLLLFLFSQGQKVVINDLTKKIASKEQTLKTMPGLIDALTAEQHLLSVTNLFGQRVYFTKFFAAYSESNPSQVTLDSLSIDASNVLTVGGTAPSYASVAKLTEAMQKQHVSFGNGASASNQPYFANVKIATASQESGGNTSFTITANVASEVTSGN